MFFFLLFLSVSNFKGRDVNALSTHTLSLLCISIKLPGLGRFQKEGSVVDKSRVQKPKEGGKNEKKMNIPPLDLDPTVQTRSTYVNPTYLHSFRQFDDGTEPTDK